MKKRYPIICRFKKEESWKDFYIQTVHYLTKVKEEFKLDYIPTLDFEPTVIYQELKTNNELELIHGTDDIEEILNNSKLKNRYYTTVKLENDKYIVDINLKKRISMTDLGFRLQPLNEKMLDVRVKFESKHGFLALQSENGEPIYCQLLENESDAIKYLYEEYLEILDGKDGYNKIQFIENVYSGISVRFEKFRYDYQILQVNI